VYNFVCSLTRRLSNPAWPVQISRPGPVCSPSGPCWPLTTGTNFPFRKSPSTNSGDPYPDFFPGISLRHSVNIFPVKNYYPPPENFILPPGHSADILHTFLPWPFPWKCQLSISQWAAWFGTQGRNNAVFWQ